MTSLIVVADAGRAKLFAAADKQYELTEVADFIHPSERGEKNPTGHAVAGRSGTRHGLEPTTLPKEHAMRQFAMELAKYVDQQFAERKYSELTLVAPPEFLGVLRGALHRDINDKVQHAIDKDLTHHSTAELCAALRSEHALH